jgi:AcrR family transcriptional regulator
VALRKGATAPTLYHHFGDKDGLMRAVVLRGMAQFMARKRAARTTADAQADLRRSWDSWIEFGIARPRLFRLMIESAHADPSYMQEIFVIMRKIVERLHAEGRLLTDVETAARTIWAASSGVLTLFMQGTPAADIGRTSDLLIDAIIARMVK